VDAGDRDDPVGGVERRAVERRTPVEPLDRIAGVEATAQLLGRDL
jgi:hypothetical protein